MTPPDEQGSQAAGGRLASPGRMTGPVSGTAALPRSGQPGPVAMKSGFKSGPWAHAPPGPQRLAGLAAEFEDRSGMPRLVLAETYPQMAAWPSVQSPGWLPKVTPGSGMGAPAVCSRDGRRLSRSQPVTRRGATQRQVPLGWAGGLERVELLGGTLTAEPTEDGFGFEL